MSFQIQIPHKIFKFQKYQILKFVFDPKKINQDKEYKNGIKSEFKLRIFGKNFINKNKIKSRIIYRNKGYRSFEYFEEIDKDYNHNDLIKLKLRVFNNIADMSYMNDRCHALISISSRRHSCACTRFLFWRMNCALSACVIQSG